MKNRLYASNWLLFFKFNGKNKNSINYLCKNRKDGCSASCSIDKATMNKIIYFVDHNIENEKDDIEINEFKQNLKKQVETNRMPLEQQFEVFILKNFVLNYLLIICSFS